MHCKSLWIKASAKCINVNVNVKVTGRQIWFSENKPCWYGIFPLFSVSGNAAVQSDMNTDKYSEPERPPLCLRNASKLTIQENNTQPEKSQLRCQRE